MVKVVRLFTHALGETTPVAEVDMGTRLAIVGAGAVGSYVGGLIARAGKQVVLIDPWPDHIQRIREEGLRVSGTQGEYLVHPRALHLHEVQSLAREPVDIAFISTKSYDTEWATLLIRDYLAPGGYVVSLQNGVNEERMAALVGWGRVVGAIASTIGVAMVGPGHVARTQSPGGAAYTVFRVGEAHGRVTPRVEELVALFSHVDSAKATTNLWGERWSKLVINSMGNPVSAITGLGSKQMYQSPDTRRLIVRLAGEAVAVGEAMGYAIEPVRGMEAARWRAALQGEGLEELELALMKAAERATEEARPSTAQDILKGRRTEIDYLNGLVVEKGQEVGVPTPAHEAVVAVVRAVERGQLAVSPDNLERVWATAGGTGANA